jgi:hypothetical protein
MRRVGATVGRLVAWLAVLVVPWALLAAAFAMLANLSKL